jgi:hypothetical protein
MHTLIKSAFSGVLLLSCSHPMPVPKQTIPDHVWFDVQVLDYVIGLKEARGRGWSIPGSRVLGKHHGRNLVQTVSCGDFKGRGDCSRVVHYDGSEEVCSRAGGVVRPLRVHDGIKSSRTRFCFPGILAEHWSEILPMMTPLSQRDNSCIPNAACSND